MKKFFASSAVAVTVLATSALGSGFTASALTVDTSDAIITKIQEEFLRPENLDNLYIQGSDWFKFSLENETWQNAAINAIMANSDDYPYDITVDQETNVFVLESINTLGAFATFWPAQTSTLMTSDHPHYTIDMVDCGGYVIDIARHDNIVTIDIQDISDPAIPPVFTYDLFDYGWTPEQLSAATIPSFTVIDGENSYELTALDFAIMGQMQELIDIVETSINPSTEAETPAPQTTINFDSELETITITVGEESAIVDSMSQAVQFVKDHTQA